MELETIETQDSFGRPYVEFNNRIIGIKEANCLIISETNDYASYKHNLNSIFSLDIESIKNEGFNLIEFFIHKHDFKELQFLKKLNIEFDLKANTTFLSGNINLIDWDKQISVKKWFISLQNKISCYHGKIKSEFRYTELDDYFYFEFEELNSLKKSYNYVLSLLSKSSLEIFEENQSTIKTKIEIPKALRTAFHQYLIFFGRFTEKAKSKRIEIQIKEYDEGLELSFDKTIDTDSVQEYLNEYINFVKSKVEDISPIFENNSPINEQQILLVDLKNQVRHLQGQVESKSMLLKEKEDRIQFLQELNITFANKAPAPIQINTNSNSNAIATGNVSIDFKLEIQGLQNDFLEFKNEIDKHLNETQKKELEKIDTELLEFDETVKAPEKVDKKSFKRLKRVIDQINKPDSDWNKAIKASKKGIEYLQKIGKTYNKVAPWLTLPSVPEQLLGK